MSSFHIEPIKAFEDNYIWAIVNQKDGLAWVVDPGDATPVIEFLEQNQLRLGGVLITHHHLDHCGGVKKLRQHYKEIPIYGPSHDDILATDTVKHEQVITLPESSLTFKVLAIPGHTLEHVAYYCEEEKWLFCGDTLFSVGCGRLFEGTAEQMYDSLVTLASLPDDTLVYCGHEYTLNNLNFAQQIEPDNADLNHHFAKVTELREQEKPTVPSTLGLEKKINPFLRGHILGVMATVVAHSGQPLETPVEIFAEMRHWKDNF